MCCDFHFNTSYILIVLPPLWWSVRSAALSVSLWVTRAAWSRSFFRFQFSSYNILPWNIWMLGSAAHQWPSVYLLLLCSSASDWIAFSRFSPSGAQSSCTFFWSITITIFFFFSLSQPVLCSTVALCPLQWVKDWQRNGEESEILKISDIQERRYHVSYGFKGQGHARS